MCGKGLEWGGGMGKMDTKTGPQRFTAGPFQVPLFVRHYARLKKDVINNVSVFFKTHRLSENFVLLSAERCPFSA